MPTAPSDSPVPARNSKLKGDRSANSTPTNSRISSRSGTVAEPTSVKDRIRAWQEHGVGAAVEPCAEDNNTPELATEIDDDKFEEVQCEKLVARTPKGKGESARGDSTPKSKKSKWVDPTNSQWVRTPRSRSTPRKRVVSDEHWKKKTLSPKIRYTLAIDTQDLESTDIEAAERALHNPGRETQRSRVANLVQLKAERDREVYGNVEDRDDDTPSLIYSENKKEDVCLPDNNKEDGDIASVTDTPVKRGNRRSLKSKRYSDDIPANKDDGRNRRRSSYFESLNNATETTNNTFQDRLIESKPRKNGILGQVLDESRRMFTKPDPQFPAPRIPSIEAWLDETPDPFLDEKPDGRPPVEMPAPLKTRSRQRRSNSPDVIRKASDEKEKPPEHIREELATGSGNRRRHKRRSHVREDGASPVPGYGSEARVCSPAQPSPDEGSVEQSLTSLKRSSARAHRQRRAHSTPVREGSASEAQLPHLDLPPPPYDENDGFDASKMPLRLKKVCPQTGAHRLSTIASVETFNDRKHKPSSIADGMSVGSDLKSTGLRRKLTTHEDLMSVLSLPRAGKSTRSSRSIRSNHVPHSELSTADLLHDLAMEEARYLKELKTLVDGVIPVLLHCVLSRSDSAIAAGLFVSSGGPDDDLKVTQPIYDMGVCLGRIELLHKRIPLQDINSLLTWAKGANKVYSEYFKAWRTGFQDVVVNLTPADDETRSKTDGDMSRDESGDIVNEKGGKADVAFLLRRPLVRVKKLSKFFSKLCVAMPSSRASDISEMFSGLTALARRRSNEEQGRQEDEAAAKIDVKRTRSLQTMAIARDVTIEKSRSVRARDQFRLTLHHSSGQRYDCQVELLLRDNSNATSGGDLLICELDNTEKWLLFPPADTANVSARNGDLQGEVIVMIRFAGASSSEGHELFLLQAETKETAAEWIQMLGSKPMPPNLQRSHSLVDNHGHYFEPSIQEPDIDFATSSVLSTKEVPNPKDVDAPIGEQTMAVSHSKATQRGLPQPYMHGALNPSDSRRNSFKDVESWVINGSPHTPSKSKSPPVSSGTPESSKTVRGKAEEATDSPSRPLRRSRATSRRVKQGDELSFSPTSVDPLSQRSSISHLEGTSRTNLDPPTLTRLLAEGTASGEGLKPERPRYHRTPSSTPSADLPSIPRVRPSSQPIATPLYDTTQDRAPATSPEKTSHSRPQMKKAGDNKTDILSADDAHASLNYRAGSTSPQPPSIQDSKPPPPPPHRSSVSSRSSISTPQAQKSPLFGRNADRRSSSPLKHEYAPSTASGSTSDSASSFDDSSSETSEDDEAADMHTPLPPMRLGKAYKPSSPSSAPTLASASLAPSNSASQAPYRTVPPRSHGPKSKSIATIYSWSDRGMWMTLHNDECSIIVTPGLISAYEMSAEHSGSKGVVDPKTISGTTSDTSSYIHEDENARKSPLVALELTPLVPIRRGTALDISIRSPPTADSKIQSSNNIMFRSRSADECEALYNLINYARINNPTYIALQNARPPVQPPVNFNINGQGARTGSASRTGSWLFGIGGSRKDPSSFRASSAPPPGSVTAISENSLANSFTSAMRRFSSSNMFSLNRSSVVLKNRGLGTPSLQSTESGTTTTGGSGSGTASPAPNQVLLNAAGGAEKTLGINNIKIRLYTRDQPGQPWSHLGPARLSVLSATEDPSKVLREGDLDGDGPSPPSTSAAMGGSRPPSSGGAIPSDSAESPRTPKASAQKGPRLPSSSYTPHRKHGNGREKRILIVAKSKSKTKPPAVLLDECLGESCFNRVGRVGMAISVWEEEMEMKKVGGVVTGKDRIYMVQFHGETEAAWVFGSVGRIRF